MKKLIATITLLGSFLIASPTFAYTVKNGDTMSQIAQDNNLTLQELAKLNPQVENLDLIYVGQTINTTEADAQNYSSEIHTPELENDPSSMNNSENPNLVNSQHAASNTQKDVKSAMKVNYSDYEIDLLARLVRAEAQGEPLDGQIAVACVVLNRVESGSQDFPHTIRGVIYDPGQFQPVYNGEINKPADADAIKAVQEALSVKRNLASGSLYFYNPQIASSHWLDSRETTLIIGHHVFKK